MRFPPLLVAAALIALPAYAQDSSPPAHISFVAGSATVYHADRGPVDSGSALPVSEPALINMPIVVGDRVRTFAASRVEVMLPDGAGIAIDADSEVEFVTPMRIRIVSGEIDHLAAQPIDPRSPSAENLPPDLQPYGPEFDQNGAWRDDPQYGSVWYPTTIAADWRPYADGYWSPYPAYGWTWIGFERWAWPTHHYGRWGYANNRWFWIPGRSYGPAWVSWGTAPGYVSWCPLGHDGRAAVPLAAFRNSSNGWTVVRHDQFGVRGSSARRDAVSPRTVEASAAFIEMRSAPSRDRRGSFSVAGRAPADRTQPIAAARSIGAAVPRTQPAPGVPTPSPQPRGFGTNDHPAYQPSYSPANGPYLSPTAPTYSPRYEPQYDPGRPVRHREATAPAPQPDGHVEPPHASGTQGPPSRPATAPHPNTTARTTDHPTEGAAREPHAAPHGNHSQGSNSAGSPPRRR